MAIKIGGVVVDGPKRGVLVLPREPEPLVFTFISVNDEDGFNKIYPTVQARKQYNVKLQRTIELVDEPDYKLKVQIRQQAFIDWVFLQSIKPSNIEWDTVDFNDPTTFGNWQKDFREAGLATSEINAIYNKYIEVNVLTDERLEEARLTFLASRAVALSESQSLQLSENQFTESGELANVLT